MNSPGSEPRSHDEAEQLVADTEMGGRHPSGAVGRLLFVTALCWALFQLWYASPFQLQFGGLNDFEARSIHLAFALFLTYAAFPAFKGSARDRIPIVDWLLGLAAAYCAAYIVLNYDSLAERSGVPTAWNLDLVVAIIGLLLLLEAARRAVGPPLAIIAILMLTYTLAGSYMPDVIAHDGKSLFKLATHQWLTQEGVFGVPLGVSTDFVFLFVLFGAMLAKAGAGNPIQTGIQGFKYDIRTAILPFLFIFNPQLLLIGIDSWLELTLVVSSAIVAMLLFAAATQGFWFIHNHLWETLVMLLIAFSLFRPGFWWDQLYDPVQRLAPDRIEQVVEDAPPGGALHFVATGENIDGDRVEKAVVLPLGEAGDVSRRLEAAGLEIQLEESNLMIDYVAYDSPAYQQQLECGWIISELQLATDRPSKYWVHIPVMGLLALVYFNQRRRLKVALEARTSA